jgi:hypothetical protein
MSADNTSIKLDRQIRDRLRAQKRGGENYNQLIDKMIDQYDPEEAIQ